MKTKYYVRFLNRAATLDSDIELADVFKIATNRGVLHSSHEPHLFTDVNALQHPRLAARVNTKPNRALVINHLKATLCASFIKDIYEDVTAYMRDILEASARNGLDPGRLVGEHKTNFEANDILKAGSWHAVVAMVSNSVFRALENERSTLDLLVKMNRKLNLQIDLVKINAALPFFELRHLLVHADGFADAKFCNSFPAFGATLGHKLQLDYRVLQSARTAIVGLIEEYDSKVIAGNLIAASELQP